MMEKIEKKNSFEALAVHEEPGNEDEASSGSNNTSLLACCSFIMDDTRNNAMIPKTTADPLEIIFDSWKPDPSRRPTA